MATAAGLMGIGAPAEMAVRLGYAISELAGVGTIQGGQQLKGYGNKLIYLTTVAGQTAITLPREAEPGDSVKIFHTGEANALVFPPLGHSINALGVNLSVNIATGASRIFTKQNATRWVVV